MDGMIDPETTPSTFDESQIPEKVRAALYANVVLPADAPTLKLMFQRYPRVFDSLVLSQIVARGALIDPWGKWVIDCVVTDLHSEQLKGWIPNTSPN